MQQRKINTATTTTTTTQTAAAAAAHEKRVNIKEKKKKIIVCALEATFLDRLWLAHTSIKKRHIKMMMKSHTLLCMKSKTKNRVLS